MATTSLANAFFQQTKSCGDAKCPGWNGVPCRSVEEEPDPRKRARPVDSILYIVFSGAAPLDERGVDGPWILGPPPAPPFGVLHYASIARVGARLL